MEGLEPPCLAALDPKSSASTNFATSATFDLGCKIKCLRRTIQFRLKKSPLFFVNLQSWTLL